MISKIHISSPFFTLPKKDVSVVSKLLKGNAVLGARVIRLLPGGQVELSINGESLIAQTDVRLKPGESLELTARESKDNLLLKIVSSGQGDRMRTLLSPARLLSRLSHLGGWEKIARTPSPPVRQLLDSLALKSDVRDDDFLPRLIQGGGLTLEKKLAGVIQSSPRPGPGLLTQVLSQDLKALIMDTLVKDPGGGMKAAEVADTFETAQVSNVSANDTGRYLFPFPFLSQGEFRFGQLILDMGDESQEKGGNSRLVKVSLLLDMSQLGPVRADFSILKGHISGRFWVKDGEIRAYMEGLMEELKDRLAKIDYVLDRVECRVVDPGMGPGAVASSFFNPLFQPGDDSVLDILI